MTKEIFILLAILSTGVTACSMLGKEKTVLPSDGEISREYQKSKDAFRAKYEGKEVTLWGKVDMINNLGNFATLRFEKSDPELAAVVCEVDKADMERFSQMKVEKGTMVRIKGTMKIEDSANDLRLKPCQLVTAGLNSMSEE